MYPPNTPPTTPCLHPSPPRRPWKRIPDVVEHFLVPIPAIIYAFLAASGIAAEGLAVEVKIVGGIYLGIGAILLPLGALRVLLNYIGKSGKRKILNADGTVNVVTDTELDRGFFIGLGMTLLGVGSFIATIPSYAAATIATIILISAFYPLWLTKDELRSASSFRHDNKSIRRLTLLNVKTGELESIGRENEYLVMSDSCLSTPSLLCSCLLQSKECRWKDSYGHAVCIAATETARRHKKWLYVPKYCSEEVEVECGRDGVLSEREQKKLIDTRRARIFQLASGVVVPVPVCPCVVHYPAPKRSFGEKVKEWRMKGPSILFRSVTTVDAEGKILKKGKPLKKDVKEPRAACVEQLMGVVEKALDHPLAFQDYMFTPKLNIIAAAAKHTDGTSSSEGLRITSLDQNGVEVDETPLIPGSTNGGAEIHAWEMGLREQIGAWRQAGGAWLDRELRRRFEGLGGGEGEKEVISELRDIYAMRHGWVCLDFDPSHAAAKSTPTDISSETIIPIPQIPTNNRAQIAKAFALIGDISLLPFLSIDPSTSKISNLLHKIPDTLTLSASPTISPHPNKVLIPLLGYLDFQNPGDDGEGGHKTVRFKPALPSLFQIEPTKEVQGKDGTFHLWLNSIGGREGVWAVAAPEVDVFVSGRNKGKDEKAVKGYLCIFIEKQEGGRDGQEVRASGLGWYEGGVTPRVEVLEIGL
ncbi:hypothetical protein HK097_009370 [Rhizophlyctis rosea]|uniref:Uncharacterized protein n=1 Tax=Rhizophlyctis rosea TaxID=64517 RepID=A0AAD5X3V0_9FUNG|nr:hypothetical protein HK097_009370 [Rhizophlyctis rosea]